ncbi:MAG: lytic transglycosylase domain-containing protein [Deltaproteobacteria bacterium]|nr:lytic transglycosylase domain-containing protein [Deltaproteobacteria bacterium]
MQGLISAAWFIRFTLFFHALVLPNAGPHIRRMVYKVDPYSLSAYDHVLRVLRENRTGLPLIEKKRLASVIIAESAAYKVDPIFVMALIKTESGFYNRSRSEKGAIGLMQIRPQTGEALAEELDLDWVGERTLLNPFVNVKLGIHYLSVLMARYDNDVVKSLAAYNLGPSNVAVASGGQDVPTLFANKVLDNYKEIKERVEDNYGDGV